MEKWRTPLSNAFSLIIKPVNWSNHRFSILSAGDHFNARAKISTDYLFAPCSFSSLQGSWNCKFKYRSSRDRIGLRFPLTKVRIFSHSNTHWLWWDKYLPPLVLRRSLQYSYCLASWYISCHISWLSNWCRHLWQSTSHSYSREILYWNTSQHPAYHSNFNLVLSSPKIFTFTTRFNSFSWLDFCQ